MWQNENIISSGGVVRNDNVMRTNAEELDISHSLSFHSGAEGSQVRQPGQV